MRPRQQSLVLQPRANT